VKLRRITTGIALLGALTSSAFATPPTKFSQTAVVSDDLACPDGTTISGTATFNENGIVFHDDAGNSVRLILHDFIEQSFVGPTGKVLSGTNRQNETLDLTTGALSVRGVLLNVKTADGTVVAHASGRLAIDKNGNITVTPNLAFDNTSAMCAALE